MLRGSLIPISAASRIKVTASHTWRYTPYSPLSSPRQHRPLFTHQRLKLSRARHFATGAKTTMAGEISYLSQSEAIKVDEDLMGSLGFSIDQLMEVGTKKERKDSCVSFFLSALFQRQLSKTEIYDFPPSFASLRDSR